MKKLLFCLLSALSISASAQNSEIRIAGGAAFNTPFGGSKSQIASPCVGLQYMNNEGRFLYGIGLNVYKMLLKNTGTVSVGNPAIPVSFMLNYKFISHKNLYIYSGINIGAGYVFLDNTPYENLKGNSPYLGFFGGNLGATKSLSKKLSLNIEYSARLSEISYTRDKVHKFGFLQSIATLAIVYKF